MAAETSTKPQREFAVIISLGKEQAHKAESLRGEGQDSVVDAIAAAATRLVNEELAGGIMLPAAMAERIRKALPDATPAAIVSAVERQASRDGDTTVVELRIDPVWLGHLRECAERAGVSLERHLRVTLDWALAQGWLGTVAQEPHKVLLTKEQYDAIAMVLGKADFTGDDLCGYLGADLSDPRSPAAKDDFLSAILREK
jgi:hypothetical protein